MFQLCGFCGTLPETPGRPCDWAQNSEKAFQKAAQDFHRFPTTFPEPEAPSTIIVHTCRIYSYDTAAPVSPCRHCRVTWGPRARVAHKVPVVMTSTSTLLLRRPLFGSQSSGRIPRIDPKTWIHKMDPPCSSPIHTIGVGVFYFWILLGLWVFEVRWKGWLEVRLASKFLEPWGDIVRSLRI